MMIRCPISVCGAEQILPVTRCTRCNADLRAYAVAIHLGALSFNRALGLARSGDLSEAAREVAIAVACNPRDEEAKLLQAEVMLTLGKKAMARDLLGGLSQEGTDARVRLRAARLLEAAVHAPRVKHRKKKARRKKKRR